MWEEVRRVYAHTPAILHMITHEMIRSQQNSHSKKLLYYIWTSINKLQSLVIKGTIIQVVYFLYFYLR